MTRIPVAEAKRALRIYCPMLPPEGLYPNKQSSYFKRYRLGKQYHRDVRFCALDALHLWEKQYRQRWEPLSKAVIELTFIFPASKPGPIPDRDNLIAAFKSGQDALTARSRGYDVAGAGVIEDDGPEHLTFGSITTGRDAQEVGVTIIIKEIRRKVEGEIQKEASGCRSNSVDGAKQKGNTRLH